MEITPIFLMADGRLRAGWRLLLFLTFLVIAVVIFQWTASAFAVRLHSSAAVLALSSAAFLGSVLTATVIAMKLFERQPFWAVGLRLGKRSLSQAAAGLGIGCLLIAIITNAEALLGSIHFQHTGAGAGQAIALVCNGAAIFAIAAASEELLFRGYAFQRLLEGVNHLTAVLLTSIAFGTVHSWNPHVTRLAVLNTMLAGVLLGIVYLRTRSLWMPIALHFSWNWSLALWGLPISGVELGKMPWQAVSSTPRVWLSGGSYGPEGGVVATIVLLAAIYLLMRKGRPQGAPLQET